MENIVTCSICGLERIPEEMIFTRFRTPACPVCFHAERQNSGIVIRFFGKEFILFRIFSPYFNFWESNKANFPDPVAGILSFPESVIIHNAELNRNDRNKYEWNWILKREYASASRGSIYTAPENAVVDMARSSELLAEKLQIPFEMFLVFRYFASFRRIIYEIAAEKDFITPAKIWCEENEEIIIRELSCLLKG